MSRLSGLQKDVLSLYRRILRASVRKDRLELLGDNNNNNLCTLLQHKTKNTTTTTTSYASTEFRKQAKETKRNDFKKIEYLIRKGDKQIKILQMPGVKLVSGTNTTTTATTKT